MQWLGLDLHILHLTIQFSVFKRRWAEREAAFLPSHQATTHAEREDRKKQRTQNIGGWKNQKGSFQVATFCNTDTIMGTSNVTSKKPCLFLNNPQLSWYFYINPVNLQVFWKNLQKDWNTISLLYSLYCSF